MNNDNQYAKGMIAALSAVLLSSFDYLRYSYFAIEVKAFIYDKDVET